MRNKCLLGLGLVFVISLTSMVAFAFSFTGTPADEVDETEMIVRAVVSEEADAMPTTEPITTTGQEQEMVKKEQSKIGSMDWDSDDAYRLVNKKYGFTIWCQCRKCGARTEGYCPDMNHEDNTITSIEECKDMAAKVWNNRAESANETAEGGEVS